MSDQTHVEDYTVEELLDANAAMNERADGLFDRLGRISTAATDRGVDVRVNLEGRLVELDLSGEAMTLTPDELAAVIFRLTQEASAAALSEGLAALEPVAGEELTAELSEVIAGRPRPAAPPTPETADETTDAPTDKAGTADEDVPETPRPRTLDEHEDFSAIESWALPR
jgi:hypothetical protein